jgi:chromate transport protein ChrA
MVAQRQPPDSKAGRSRSNEEINGWIRVASAITTIGEKFGVAFAVFLILLLAVYVLGSKQTHDDFMRELLFGSITNTRYLTLFFVVLILTAIFGVDTRIRAYRTESAEMKRLADQKSEWQQRAIGAPLSHTEESE